MVHGYSPRNARPNFSSHRATSRSAEPQSSVGLTQRPSWKAAVIPTLSYGSVAMTAMGSAALAFATAGPAAASIVAGSILLPTAFTLFQVILSDGRFVAKAMGGEPADPGLISMVNEVTRRAGYQHSVHVYEIPTREANAFAAGIRVSGSTVAVTTGLRNELTEAELKAVIAHEIGHLLARDTMKNMHMAAAIAGLGGLYSAGRQLWRSRYFLDSPSPAETAEDKRESRSSSIGLLGAGLMGVGFVGQCVAHLLRLGSSRRYEFAADGVASELYGPDTMISALKKIHVSSSRTQRDALGARGGAFSHMYISNPSEAAAAFGASKRGGGWISKLANLLSTHPTLEERVDALLKRKQQRA